VGRLKDSVTRGFTYRSGARASRSGGGFVRCTHGNPCPICGREKFCSIGEVAIICTRVSEGAVRTGSNGAGEFYVHMLTNEARERRKDLPVTPSKTTERAPVDVRDRAYRALLAELPLDTVDREALVARGLTEAHVRENGYRTLRIQGRARLALAIINAIGEDAARGVPGVFWKSDGNRGWWSLAGSEGVVIPVRDLEARIVGLKIRRRDPIEKGARYLWLTSSNHEGAAADNAAHVPSAALALRPTAGRLVITEGELKADVATALSGVPVVSVPGVESWEKGLDVALAWGVQTVDVCFDMDRMGNRKVADAARCLVSELRREGLDAGTRKWDRRFKGLDDFLLARSQGQTVA